MKTTKKFGATAYQGHFRDYQRHLLRRVEEHLDENKLNIVTPPGSGKIILGLEIARRMGEPCLILSSTASMQNHWGANFMAHFVPAEEQSEVDAYVSYDLQDPSLITSITYAELSKVIKAQTEREEAAKKAAEEAGTVYKEEIGVGFNVIHWLQENGIGTILLDEAHHLTDEWQTALETFLGVLGGEIRVLCMTSTPPYDLSSEGWERYVSLCGEITDEICVPELVKGQALCPHRDLVYFNYPSDAESDGIRGYRLRVDAAITEAAVLGFMSEINRRITKLSVKRSPYIYGHHAEIVAVLKLLNEYGHPVNITLYRTLTSRKKVEQLTLADAQMAFNFLLESQTILHDGEKDQLIDVFTHHRVITHRHVHLDTTDKVRRTILSSTGKLSSIAAITDSEGRSLGTDLRQVILTEAMDKHELKLIGTEFTPSSVSMVAVFETLRHHNPLLPIGCLSGKTVILPETLEQKLLESGLSKEALTVEPIGYTRYSIFRFAESVDVMGIISPLFRDGYIRVLIGASEDLGEEWEDSFVNTLILPVVTQSFVDASRMRGRVIHATKENPAKSAHIWHLVTVERAYSLSEYPTLRLASRLSDAKTSLHSADYHLLCRQFECFMGPNETTGELENGIECVTEIKPPYDEAGLKSVNAAMLGNTDKREKLTAHWKEAMIENTHPIAEARVPEIAKVPVLTGMNVFLLLLALASVIIGISQMPTLIVFTYLAYIAAPDILWIVVILLVLVIAAIIWGVVFVIYMLPLLLNHLFTASSIRSICRALLKTFKELGLVNKNAELVMEPIAGRHSFRIYLDNCSHTEQMTYQKAVAEIFSEVGHPRYLMVRAGWFKRLLWKWSFACPSIIGKNDVSVKVFAKHMRMSMGIMKFQYTHREPGRKYLIFARNRSYLNQNHTKSEKRLHVLKHDRT